MGDVRFSFGQDDLLVGPKRKMNSIDCGFGVRIQNGNRKIATASPDKTARRLVQVGSGGVKAAPIGKGILRCIDTQETALSQKIENLTFAGSD